MSTVNQSQLITKLQQVLDVQYLKASSQVDDVSTLVLAIKGVNDPNIITVKNVVDLPNLRYFGSPSGMIYYLSDIDIFAISSGTKWLTLDGRLLRIDINYTLAWHWGAIFGGNQSPVSVLGDFIDWCQVSTNGAHFGVRRNGTLWAWGSNSCGRLGDGTTTNTSSPVSVVGGFTDWCQVSAGCAHSLGVRKDGTAWAWGCNSCGQLGDNSITNRSSPVLVVGGFTDWCQVSPGGVHSLGLRTNGTLWAWGNGGFGRLGDNSTTSKRSPVSVVGGFTDWCQVSAGYNHSLGVRTNGTLWAWGCNGVGQLGDNTTTSRSSPVSVVGGFTDWCQVSGGGALSLSGHGHSIGLRSNGTLWAWGSNSCGRLGDNTTTNRASPVSVVGGFTDWCQVSAGVWHNMGVRTNGTIWGWGCNSFGRLGDGTTINRSSPVSVVGGFTDWCQVSAGGSVSLAIRAIC
jgi:alpha-tubulin suppressor-like RCC1 family protein